MVAQCMEGDIKCRSVQCKGTCFDFYVRAACNPDDKGYSQKEHLKFKDIVKMIKKTS